MCTFFLSLQTKTASTGSAKRLDWSVSFEHVYLLLKPPVEECFDWKRKAPWLFRKLVRFTYNLTAFISLEAQSAALICHSQSFPSVPWLSVPGHAQFHRLLVETVCETSSEQFMEAKEQTLFVEVLAFTLRWKLRPLQTTSFTESQGIKTPSLGH